MCPPAYVLFFFVFLQFSTLSGFPLGKFALAFFTLVKSKDVRHDAAGNRFDLVLWNVGVIDELFSSTQVLSSV